MSEHITNKRKIILVTDGDDIARKAVEKAAANIGARCISKSAGNPTHLPGYKIIELIQQAKWDPVVVMVDDRGHTGEGPGEHVMRDIAKCPDIEIIGVIAVASNTEGVRGIKTDYSITKYGNTIKKTVDKHGNPKSGEVIYGDTVDILNMIEVPVIVGIGDPGKMNGRDGCGIGAPVITKAMQQIINRSY